MKLNTLKSTCLSIGYGDVIVSENINVSLGSGEIVALVGPNGAGKSTLFKTLSGYIKPLSGEIAFSGIDASKISPKERARILSVVLTERPDDLFLKVFDVVAAGRYPYVGMFGKLEENDKIVIEESLDVIGIKELKNRLFITLSDGERQKVMIAKALAQNTPIIFLDEPAAFLDYPSKIELFSIMKKLATEQNKTIIYSSHDLELLLRYTENVWVMAKNKPFVAGKCSELLENDVIKNYFGLKDVDNECLKKSLNL